MRRRAVWRRKGGENGPGARRSRHSGRDGPQGISGTLVSGASGMAYTSEVVIASTWNIELIERMGEMMGEDGLHIPRNDDGKGLVGWYAPPP